MTKANTNESLRMLRGNCTELEWRVGVEASRRLVQSVFNGDMALPDAWDRTTDLTGEYKGAEDLKRSVVTETTLRTNLSSEQTQFLAIGVITGIMSVVKILETREKK
jgi:hypothetical protein